MRNWASVAVAIGLLLVCGLAGAAEIVPDGFDSGALDRALARCEPGDTIRLKEGTYELIQRIHVPSQCKLVGAGQDKTTLYLVGEKHDVFVGLDGREDVEVAHMTLDGREKPNATQGIAAGNARRLWIHHVTIRNLKAETWGPHGILWSGHNPSKERGVTDSRISHCLIENVGVDAKYGGGIRMAWGSVRNLVEHNVIRKVGRGGIFGDHSEELTIRNNQVSEIHRTGLGIEIWGGCPRSVIEDNVVDHWISVDAGDQSAVRRNTVGTDSGRLKGYGIEVIASNVVVTDNVVGQGAQIGLSMSNKPEKRNVFWGYNTVRDCNQWGSQLQGDEGGVKNQYFYKCVFENTKREAPGAPYPKDSGQGFRLNGDCENLVFEDCKFRNNGGTGFQPGGKNVDQLMFVRCSIIGNQGATFSSPGEGTRMGFLNCRSYGNRDNRPPNAKPLRLALPKARFRVMSDPVAGKPVQFRCMSQARGGEIVERLWDFGDGIPEMSEEPTKIFDKPGDYRVTLVVWGSNGQGGRHEETVHVREATGSASEPPSSSTPDSPFRTWRDASGQFELVAALESCGKDEVVLKRQDNGSTIRVPIVRLSEEDRSWLQTHVKDLSQQD